MLPKKHLYGAQEKRKQEDPFIESQKVLYISS
jgi:hypothetical protein